MSVRENPSDRAARRAQRIRLAIGDEFRNKRLGVGLTQGAVATASGVARSTYSRIEAGRRPGTSLDELVRIGMTLGLELSARAYPGGEPLRDAAQLSRLGRLLEAITPPISSRTEVPLPRTTDHPELRAWDAVLFGLGQRTAVEVEMRVSDAQALERKLALKRRDDPTDGFLLVLADTRHNRRVLAEYPTLLADLPRLRRASVFAALRSGRHPSSGLVLL